MHLQAVTHRRRDNAPHDPSSLGACFIRQLGFSPVRIRAIAFGGADTIDPALHSGSPLAPCGLHAAPLPRKRLMPAYITSLREARPIDATRADYSLNHLLLVLMGVVSLAQGRSCCCFWLPDLASLMQDPWDLGACIMGRYKRGVAFDQHDCVCCLSAPLVCRLPSRADALDLPLVPTVPGVIAIG